MGRIGVDEAGSGWMGRTEVNRAGDRVRVNETG